MSAVTFAFDRELILSHEPSHPNQPPYANTTYGVKARTELVVIEPMLFHFSSMIQHDFIVPSIVGPNFLGLRDGSGSHAKLSQNIGFMSCWRSHDQYF